MTFSDILDAIYNLVWSAGLPVGQGNIPWVVILLLGAGIYLTLYLGFIQFRKLGHGIAVTTGKYDDPNDPGDVPHYQALTTALSATVGIGNIAGVALAIHFGGPGALFWMWITALLGMATKYSEVTLAQNYRDVLTPQGDLAGASLREKMRGTVSGGPMYYIEKGLGKHWKPLAVFFAIMLICTSFLTGNAVQANTVADTMNSEFGFVDWATGLVLVTVVGLVILGGITRIGRVTSTLVPVMAAIYVLAGLLILIFNAADLPAAIGSVFSQAFNPSTGVAGAGAGAFIFTLTYGVQRGLFSNEAGQGSAPIAHSAAQTDHPPSEGVVALLEPFIDTILICTITGLAIVVTGAWDARVPTELELGGDDVSYRVQGQGGIFSEADPPQQVPIEGGVPQVQEGQPEFAWHEAVVERFYTEMDEGDNLSQPFTGTLYPSRGLAVSESGTEVDVLYGNAAENGAPLTQLAFQRGLSPLGNWGGYIVIFSVLLFAVSTAISWSYYGDRCATYLFGESGIIPYKVLFLVMHFIGAVGALTVIWTIGDIALGLVIVPNLIGVLLLSPKLREITTNYFQRQPWLGNGTGRDDRPQQQRRREREEEV